MSPDSVTDDQILLMCRRAFGSAVRVASTRELSGGTFNRAFLIDLDDQQVILRIAPPPEAILSWDEQWLMRREVQIQPFFAPIAILMPRILMADFTHQVIDRDYIFQTYLAGERWDEISDQLTTEEQSSLWEQFGRITRTIHQIRGTVFGGPYPAPEFPTWSQAIIDRLERTTRAMIEAHLDAAVLRSVLDMVRGQPSRLDDLRHPHLLHGDLWLFNILVHRSPGRPEITGILDADRAWWGDPLADWTMFVISKSATPDTRRFHSAFWGAYGKIEQTPETVFRSTVYDACHIGTALTWAMRQHDEDTLQRGKRDLQTVADTLHTL